MIVHCHGCFDFLTIGHIRHLKEARSMGNWLIVTITADKFITKKNRPIFNEDDRLEFLESLRFVDHAQILFEPTAINYIREVKPDLYVKGGEYRLGMTPALIEEKLAVESVGGKLVFTEACEFHTTDMIKKLKLLTK